MAKDRVDRDDEDLVRLYLTDIGQYTLLTKDDEVRLAKAIEAGKEAIAQLDAGGKEITASRRRELRRTARQGEEAERQFVQSNLRLVVSIAKKYQASGLPLLDLIQEGNLGLMHAVEKFDWRKGFKFSTYATWWIRQAITRGIANTGRTIRLPVHAGDTLARLQKARSRLELKYGRPATLAELAARGRDARGQGHRGAALRRRAAVVVGAAARGRRRRARRRRRGPLGRESRSRWPPPRCCPRRSPACWRRSTSASAEILKLRFGLDRGEPRTLEEVGRALQPHPRAHPPDRGAGDEQAAPPVERHRRPRPPRRLTTKRSAVRNSAPPSARG